jgi:BMFP domain-containing protein YqiC
MLRDMDLVTREEFEAVKAVAATARAEQERLADRVARLEAALAELATLPPPSAAPRAASDGSPTGGSADEIA